MNINYKFVVRVICSLVSSNETSYTRSLGLQPRQVGLGLVMLRPFCSQLIRSNSSLANFHVSQGPFLISYPSMIIDKFYSIPKSYLPNPHQNPPAQLAPSFSIDKYLQLHYQLNVVFNNVMFFVLGALIQLG